MDTKTGRRDETQASPLQGQQGSQEGIEEKSVKMWKYDIAAVGFLLVCLLGIIWWINLVDIRYAVLDWLIGKQPVIANFQVSYGSCPSHSVVYVADSIYIKAYSAFIDRAKIDGKGWTPAAPCLLMKAWKP